MNRNRAPAKLWQTTTFRMAIVFAAVFGLGTAVLLLVLDIAVGRFAEETARDALRDQVAVLVADANAEGGPALIASLKEHVAGGQPERFSYLVVTPSGERLAAGLPASVEQIRGEASIHLPMVAEEDETVDSSSIEVIVLTDRARDGTFIAVGRDTYALEELRQWLHRLAIIGGLIIVLLALIGGAAAGAVLLRRLKGVTDAAGRVMSGDLSERLPSLGIGREFDDLADTLNAMLERLESAMEAIRQVSADVAHDLRTPLTRLRNRLEDAQAAPAEARDDLLTDAVGETDRLLEIFAALLRLAQIEGGTSRRFAVFDLVPTVAEVVEAYQPAADEAGWTLSLVSDPEAIVEGDSALLAQAVASLIDNALTHGAPGKTITVAVSRYAGEATVTVADDGPGAPEAELVNLTRRFYRLDRSRHTVGSGLGLSMVSAIATLHGVPLRIANRHPGLAVSLTVPTPANSLPPA
ncbi:MAG: HAMP domain-containing protein [Caulobacteraceae bacterium]|nr:HAMP domain-containing protein [Caulobacteraceae bacterium]